MLNIQFTVEMPAITMGKNSIAFLDTKTTVNEDGKVKVVYLKATHTSKYLDFLSPGPSARQKSCC